MKILFLSAWFPFPPDNGSKIRIYNLIRHLSGRHELDLISLYQNEDALKYTDKFKDIISAGFYFKEKMYRPNSIKSLIGLFSTQPRWLNDVYDRSIQYKLDNLTDEKNYDVIIASQLRMSPYILGDKRIPKIIEEIEMGVQVDALLRAKNVGSALRQSLRWLKFSSYIRHLLTRVVDGCTVVSALERSYILRIKENVENLSVIPNGIDVSQYSEDYGPIEANSLIFSGALTYIANRRSLDRFLDKTWPLIRGSKPETNLYITGAFDGVDVKRIQNVDGVRLTGYLDDVRPRVATSQVAIVPLIEGGGTRLKILEAMALGTPVVSTSKGAEGLNISNGENIVIADAPEDFARSVTSLMDNPSLSRSISIKGKQFIRDHYNWHNIGSLFEEFLEYVVKSNKDQLVD